MQYVLTSKQSLCVLGMGCAKAGVEPGPPRISPDLPDGSGVCKGGLCVLEQSPGELA